MKKNTQLKYFIILILFLLVLIRAYPLFNSTVFDNVHTYEYIRNSQENTGKNLIDNDANIFLLSDLYSFPRIFFNSSLSIYSLKIIEVLIFILFLVSIILVVYQLTSSYYSVLISLILVGITPLFFSKTYNSLNPEFLPISLCLLIIFQLLRISFPNKEMKRYKKPSKKNIYLVLFFSFLMLFFVSYAIILVLHIFIYLLISFIDKSENRVYFIEYSIFFITFILSSLFLINSNAIQILKAKIFSQNIPVQVQLSQTDFFHPFIIFSLIGLISIIGGMFAINYFYSIKDKVVYRKYYFISCGVISSLILLFFKLGNSFFIKIYLSSLFIILISSYLKEKIDYAMKYYVLNFSEKTYWGLIIIILMIGGLSVNYSVFLSTPLQIYDLPEETYELFLYMQELNDYNSMIVVPYYYGFVAGAVAKKDYLMDFNFYKVNNAEVHIENIAQIYKNINNIQVHILLNNYLDNFNIDTAYIIYDEQIFDHYNTNLNRISKDNCFSLEKNIGNSSLFRYECKNER